MVAITPRGVTGIKPRPNKNLTLYENLLQSPVANRESASDFISDGDIRGK
jgi:hypothetical protein